MLTDREANSSIEGATPLTSFPSACPPSTLPLSLSDTTEQTSARSEKPDSVASKPAARASHRVRPALAKSSPNRVVSKRHVPVNLTDLPAAFAPVSYTHLTLPTN